MSFFFLLVHVKNKRDGNLCRHIMYKRKKLMETDKMNFVETARQIYATEGALAAWKHLLDTEAELEYLEENEQDYMEEEERDEYYELLEEVCEEILTDVETPIFTKYEVLYETYELVALDLQDIFNVYLVEVVEKRFYRFEQITQSKHVIKIFAETEEEAREWALAMLKRMTNTNNAEYDYDIEYEVTKIETGAHLQHGDERPRRYKDQ